MTQEQALDKIEQLAYSYDKGKIESMREGIKTVLIDYGKELCEEKCGSCIHDYHKKGTKGYHDVEEFYKE